MASLTRSSQHDGGKVRRKKSSIHLDMTPMVDLGFLLITFFMLTASLSKPYVLEMFKPQDKESIDHRPIPEKNLLTLVLAKGNKVYWFQGQTNPTVNVSNFSAEGIRSVLLQKKKEIQKLHVFIKAADESRYQNLVDALDEMAIAGIENYSIVDITPSDNTLLTEFNRLALTQTGIR